MIFFFAQALDGRKPLLLQRHGGRKVSLVCPKLFFSMGVEKCHLCAQNYFFLRLTLVLERFSYFFPRFIFRAGSGRKPLLLQRHGGHVRLYIIIISSISFKVLSCSPTSTWGLHFWTIMASVTGYHSSLSCPVHPYPYLFPFSAGTSRSPPSTSSSTGDEGEGAPPPT